MVVRAVTQALLVMQGQLVGVVLLATQALLLLQGVAQPGALEGQVLVTEVVVRQLLPLLGLRNKTVGFSTPKPGEACLLYTSDAADE